jgi:hypothetical protein
MGVLGRSWIHRKPKEKGKRELRRSTDILKRTAKKGRRACEVT